MKAVNSFSIFAAVVMATTASTFGQTYSTLFTPGIPAGPLSLATSWSGLFDGSTLTFNRALQSANGSETTPNAPTALAPAGLYRLNQQSFTPTVSGVHNFYSAQAFDGFLHLYSPNFNSAAALTDVLAGDDDMTTLNGGSVPNRNGVTTTEDSGFQFNLTANTPYVVVTSSFTASTTTPAAGAYYNEIYAPSTPATPRSPITTIPDATSSTVPG